MIYYGPEASEYSAHSPHLVTPTPRLPAATSVPEHGSTSPRENRQRLTEKCPHLIVAAAPDHPGMAGRDSALLGPEFAWLTGLRSPGARLILSPQSGEILFIPGLQSSTWWGDVPPLADIQQLSGIHDVRDLTEFPRALRALAHAVESVHVLCGENPYVATHGHDQFVESLRHLLPLHRLERAVPLVAGLRAVKTSPELAASRRAAGHAVAGMQRAIGFLRPGVQGYEVKAEYLHEIMRRGSGGWGCPPLTAAGVETLQLHSRADRRPWASGEVALLDFTAEHHGYHADIARCVPVSGRFTARQKFVGELIHSVLQECIALLVPGVTLATCHAKAQHLLQTAAQRLGLPQSVQAQSRHRVFHHIGMEVHDPVSDDTPLSEGAVLAVEPGLYLPEEGFGMRMEDTVALISGGIEILTKDAPSQPSEVEQLFI